MGILQTGFTFWLKNKNRFFYKKDLNQFSVALFNDDIGHAVNLVQLQVLLMKEQLLDLQQPNVLMHHEITNNCACKLQNIQCILMQDK